MDFDLSSRGQWDDFRVWFFARSDVCFARLVYHMVRTQVPPRRGEASTCWSASLQGTDLTPTQVIPE